MPIVELESGKRFDATSEQSILECARAHGLVLEYSCRTGRCGVCKATLSQGETVALRPEASLSDADRAAGLILTCCRAATTDIKLDIEDLGRLADVEIKTMPAKISAIDHLAPTVIRVTLRTPPTSLLRFLPGQYIDVMAQGVRRSYSLANATRADGTLELLIKRFENGVLSEYWFERAKPGDLLRIEGPLGTFFLRDSQPKNFLFLATGTGIAPVRAMLEEITGLPEIAANHRIAVYWGNREEESFCWDSSHLGLDLRLALLLSGSGGAWNGRRGYVQDAALEDGFDPLDTVVYACGSTNMIASASALFVSRGLPRRRFFSDAFVISS